MIERDPESAEPEEPDPDDQGIPTQKRWEDREPADDGDQDAPDPPAE